MPFCASTTSIGSCCNSWTIVGATIFFAPSFFGFFNGNFHGGPSSPRTVLDLPMGVFFAYGFFDFFNYNLNGSPSSPTMLFGFHIGIFFALLFQFFVLYMF